VIRIDDLAFQYPDGQLVFEGFNWSVEAGQTWTVLGPSGCGKTTLLYLLAGLRKASAGSLLINGQPLDRPRPRTGLVLQDFGLLPWATVQENAALGLQVRGFYGPDGKHAPPDEVVEQIQLRVDPWLQRMGLSQLADSYPGQLSGGQRQRTAIARTLVLNPDLLLMDEPFAALDAPTREGLQDLTLRLQREGDLTTILITHSIEEAALMGEFVLVLGDLPNRQAHFFHQPQAADPEFRQTETYNQRITQLREAMEKTA
jgi:NitT/TauT family transport system ATP-binding protein